MKFKTSYKVMMLLLLLVSCTFGLQSKQAQAAKQSYISSIEIQAGSEAQEKLKLNGYTSLIQCLNMGTWQKKKNEMVDGKGLVYMGYRLLTEQSMAITDLLVLKSESAPKTVKNNGITYTRVSDISLNQGVDGDDIYLYYTKNKKAGEPIIDFDISSYQKGNTDDFSGFALLNDGSSPIRTLDGEAANFDSGREGIELYVHMVRKDMCKPYVSKVFVATAANKRAAIKKLAKKGCDYYVLNNQSAASDTYEMIGYKRSKSKKDALLAVSSKDNNSWEFSSSGKGHYLAGLLSAYSGKKIAMTAEECAEICFGGGTGTARTYLNQEEDLANWKKDKTKYSKETVSVNLEKEKVEIALIYENKTETIKAVKKTEESVEAVSAPAIEATPNLSNDKKDTEKEKTVSGAAVSTTGTSLSTGSVTMIVVGVLILVLVGGMGVILAKRK